MQSTVIRLETPDYGLSDVAVRLSGSQLIVDLTYEKYEIEERRSIVFDAVMAFRFVAEPGAFCGQGLFDSVRESKYDQWSKDVINAIDAAFLPNPIKFYQSYLSNFGSIDVVASSVYVR